MAARRPISRERLSEIQREIEQQLQRKQWSLMPSTAIPPIPGDVYSGRYRTEFAVKALRECPFRDAPAYTATQ